jgi:hypothetical protein
MPYYHTEVSFINTYDGENVWVAATSNIKEKVNTQKNSKYYTQLLEP